MWIIADTGFVSLVQHSTKPDHIRARARRVEHLQETFDLQDGDIIDLGANCPDYRFHADIPRANVAQKLHEAVMDLSYESHVKESVTGNDRVFYAAMLDCWRALYRLQDLPAPPDHDWWTPYDEWEIRNREVLAAGVPDPPNYSDETVSGKEDVYVTLTVKVSGSGSPESRVDLLTDVLNGGLALDDGTTAVLDDIEDWDTA